MFAWSGARAEAQQPAHKTGARRLPPRSALSTRNPHLTHSTPPNTHSAHSPLIIQVRGYVLYRNGQYAEVDYPLDGAAPDVAGCSFHHGRFVQRLRGAAAGAAGATVREATVRALVNGERESLLHAGLLRLLLLVCDVWERRLWWSLFSILPATNHHRQP
jgi:hypothetical protein